LFPPYGASMPVITPSTQAVATPSTASNSATSSPTIQATAATSTSPASDAGWRDVATVGQRILAIAGLDAGGGLVGDHQVGSNDWVIAPSKSKSGGAPLANAPPLGIAMPSVWFMNGLHCRTVSADCPYDVAGVSFPGVPGVV